ncbi:MAG: polymerase subunit alpha, partial [Glaciihabitans sp.]|nr:polymerase subunit alpha [Glaciihabitans sp.]
MRVVDELTGVGFGQADVLRRHLGKPDDVPAMTAFVRQRALARDFTPAVIERKWNILLGFGRFGFAKAHGAAFAITTLRSAWLLTHHPAVYFAGLLTHDPGMWPEDLMLADARKHGVPILGYDVQHSGLDYRVEELSDGRRAVRKSLVELAGSSEGERARIAEHQPFTSLQDFRDRVRPKRRTFEALARVGALDAFINYDTTRRGELLAHIHSLSGTAIKVGTDQLAFEMELPTPLYDNTMTSLDLRGQTQSDLELRDLHLSADSHQMEPFYGLFKELGVTPASKLPDLPGGSEVLVAGVRRASHTPPMRNGRRTVFLSLDDGSGPIANVVLFDEAQNGAGPNLFRSHFVLVKGTARRAGAKAVSVT